MINLDDLQKIELRIGKVLSAERVEGSEKLLKLAVDVGEKDEMSGEPRPRQILSGIAKWYAPEDVAGKSVVVVANLEPRSMMGLLSQGMLLAAHAEDGGAVLLESLSAVPAGAKIT